MFISHRCGDSQFRPRCFYGPQLTAPYAVNLPGSTDSPATGSETRKRLPFPNSLSPVEHPGDQVRTKAPANRARLVQGEVVAGLGAQQNEDLLQRVLPNWRQGRAPMNLAVHCGEPIGSHRAEIGAVGTGFQGFTSAGAVARRLLY